MFCKKCGSTKINSRKNYSHGRRSKPTTVLSCKECGSREIDIKSNDWRKRRKRY